MRTTRRDLITGATAIVAAPLMPLPVRAETAADPAVTAYAVWQQARAAHAAACRRLTAADNAFFAAKDRNAPDLATYEAARDEAEEAQSECCDAEDDAVGQLNRVEAATWQGVALKLAVLSAYVRALHLNGLEEATGGERLTVSAAADAGRLAGVEAPPIF